MSRVAVLLIALLLVVPASIASAQSPPVWSITGRVTDATDLPLAGAQISVTAVDTGLSRLAVTGPDGRFSLTGLVGPRQTLVANADGFDRVTRDIEPGTGAITIQLAPARRVESVTVLSGSREEQRRDELSSRVDVVSRARLDVIRASTGDVLREVPGLL